MPGPALHLEGPVQCDPQNRACPVYTSLPPEELSMSMLLFPFGLVLSLSNNPLSLCFLRFLSSVFEAGQDTES